MTALRLRSAARLRSWISSSFCSHTLNPGRDGQSMLATDATHAPRNSRGAGGGSADAQSTGTVGGAGGRNAALSMSGAEPSVRAPPGDWPSAGEDASDDAATRAARARGLKGTYGLDGGG